MKEKVCICDLCGKPITYPGRWYVRYKVKINKTFSYWVHGNGYAKCEESRRWFKIDCHKECVDKLFGFITSPELEPPKPPHERHKTNESD